MVIEVNKDIDRYQESVAMGLTARQLIFSIASVVVGGGIVLLLYKYIGLMGSAYVTTVHGSTSTPAPSCRWAVTVPTITSVAGELPSSPTSR